MKILSLQPVPASEAKNSLAKKSAKTLGYEQKICLDLLKKHVSLGVLDARKLVTELLEIRRVRQEHAVTIANLLPVDKDDVRLVFAKEKLRLGEEADKILAVVAKYRK